MTTPGSMPGRRVNTDRDYQADARVLQRLAEGIRKDETAPEEWRMSVSVRLLAISQEMLGEVMRRASIGVEDVPTGTDER